MVIDHEKLYTVTEVAGLVNFTPMTLYRWIKLGLIPCIRFGRSIRIRGDEVYALVELVETLTVETRSKEA